MKRAALASSVAAFIACSRAPTSSSTTTTIASSSSSSSSASPSASIASSVPLLAPARVVRLPVAVAHASAEVGGATPHVADDAFDGDPFDGWCAPKLGKDAWVEAELATPQRIRRVRVAGGLADRMGDGAKSAAQHGRVDLVRVQLDASSPVSAAIDPKTSDATIDVADGVVAKRVRVLVDAATKGKSQDDACIAEIELWGDAPASGAPASVSAVLFGPDLDAALAALPTSPRAKSVELLGGLGFSESVRHDVAFYTAISGARRVLDLDGDDGLESLVDVGFAQRMSDAKYVVERRAIAVVDDDVHDHAVLGRRWIFAQHCIAPPTDEAADAGSDGDAVAPTLDLATRPPLVLVTPHVAHAPPLLDLIVRSTALDACGDRESGRDAAMVLTVARGALETIASWQTAWTNPVESKTALVTPSFYLECSEGAPCGLAFDDARAKTTRWTFEPKSFLYR